MNSCIKLESGKISYELKGKGRPLVFLHGFLEDVTIWYSVKDSLSSSNKVLLIDLPGHGKSDFSFAIKTMADMALAVKQVLDSLEIKHPIVFGHSMGGYVGLELAKIYPVNLVLVHSNFWADSSEKKKDRNRVAEVAQNNKDIFIRVAIPNLFYTPNRQKLKNEISELIERACRMNKDAIIVSTKGMRDRLDNSEVLREQEVTIIQGSNDPVVPIILMEEKLEKVMNKYNLVLIKKCGHLGFLEQPKEFLAVVKGIIHKFSAFKTNI